MIARKNWKAIFKSGNGVITAVASRDATRSQTFIDDCQKECPFDTPPTALGSYDELLASEDVDAVYIPLPTGLRKEWVIKAAEAGKHVVCEKPCAISKADLREMLDACQSNDVQFMDGVMYMHSKRMDAMRAILDAGEHVGTIKRIVSQFSFFAPDEFLTSNIRVSSNLEPQGCVGDLGWYTIRFALWTMKYRMPEKVSGRILAEAGRADSPDKVPMEFSAELLFSDGVSASFYNSFLTEHQQWCNISGTRGNLTIKDFVLPALGNELSFETSNAQFQIDGCEFVMEDHTRIHKTPEYSNSHSTAQETNLYRTFADIVLSGQPDSHWAELAWKTQVVMDACLESAANGSELVEVSE